MEAQFNEMKLEKNTLMESYRELSNEERELSVELRAKYGEGTYDVATNTFTPNK